MTFFSEAVRMANNEGRGMLAIQDIESRGREGQQAVRRRHIACCCHDEGVPSYQRLGFVTAMAVDFCDYFWVRLCYFRGRGMHGGGRVWRVWCGGDSVERGGHQLIHPHP